MNKNISNYTNFSFKGEEEEENESQSILLDPKGPYATLPKYKRGPAPKVTDLNDLTQLEKNVFNDPYGKFNDKTFSNQKNFFLS